MDIRNRTKIKLSSKITDNKFVNIIKDKLRKDYFFLTYWYVAIYYLITATLIYGFNYLVYGDIRHDGETQIIILVSTLVAAMAKMSQKVKEDIVSNYWKLKKGIRKR
jgi:hypothetical protein